jgi:four helix bundle protein
MKIERFSDLRAWQTCSAYKNAVYKLCRESRIAADPELARQLISCVASAPANIAEGFARFNPPDNARFVVMARASLVESQNHLFDAVDRGHITEEQRVTHNQLAEMALREVTGWLAYLRSSEALAKARKARERHTAARTRNIEP